MGSIAKASFDIIWSFDNSVFYRFDALPFGVLKISHIVDLNQNFKTKSAAQSANICFGVISPIVERLKLHNPLSFKVGHGLNVVSDYDFNFVTPGLNDIKALYLGNLAMSYLDWENLYRTAIAHSEVDFIFIGSNGDNFDLVKNSTHDSKLNISKLSNVFFHNYIPASAIHSVISRADILMISYQEKYHLDQSNSHKVLEYLYSGKPIVATFTQEYEGKDLMYMSKKNAEWPSIFEYVISNLEVCSSKELADKRKNYALEHTYDKQIDRIEKLLASLPA
ncbi:MAG: hypothetical protein RLN88_10065 [Ekhidna sp.]|uniref:hypothetical protein n=1 Tax=Ekhidna sp. TaxID=2608089 RepID=UPI0032EBC787